MCKGGDYPRTKAPIWLIRLRRHRCAAAIYGLFLSIALPAASPVPFLIRAAPIFFGIYAVQNLTPLGRALPGCALLVASSCQA